ncbi:M20/M25/M40 family metallo-hydrolase [Flavobacterium beibuense]|uniref:M20/M25/M40 family metallo-hydrolase n=1 Tax=Flavobacterium beibuense TaxID=657326 RepID=UPI003A8DDF5E
MKKIYLAAILISLSFATVGVSQSVQNDFENALDEWHDGHYINALTTFKNILNTSSADLYFEKIALQTGELYQITELSDDGTNIRFWGDDIAIYERRENGKTFTYVYNSKSQKWIRKVNGNDLIVLSDGSVVYKRLKENEVVKKAAQTRDKDIAEAYATRDRALFDAARTNYALVEATNTELFLWEKNAKKEKSITPKGLIVGSLVASKSNDRIFFVGMKTDGEYSNIYEYSIASKSSKMITDTPNFESNLEVSPDGNRLVFEYSSQNSLPATAKAKAEISGKTGVLNIATNKVVVIDGNLVSANFDNDVALIQRSNKTGKTLLLASLNNEDVVTEIITSDKSLNDAALSPKGTKVAYTLKEQDDYEVYVYDSLTKKTQRVSHELQHDRFPQFLSESKLVAAKGEGRHRRSFMYDLDSGATTKLFHNNTVRTIAPEYQWASNSSGTQLLIVAERDGDTISPERGVYLMHLDKKISKNDLVLRIEENLRTEKALREKGERMFAKIADEVKEVVSQASVNRVYTYENNLYKFDSKYISMPGNDKASEYIFKKYASFGYSPEYQWFTPPGRQVYGGKTANVIATLKGTTNPELLYVVSSHYDSVEDGPGADDNTSGTAALLEAARILSKHPMRATIMFVSFTGEEAGLLGSREFVRQAQEKGYKIIGALNNDMVGMANDSRLDNTIRYSNPGIRDVQHASAFLFTDMVTYDALYYKSTDAHAYYEAYGDIVGGIGSYPVLGNPFYHQWNDNLETINHQLVTEVSKTTAATLMLLASSPSRIQNVEIKEKDKNTFQISWSPSVESDVTSYIVRYVTKSGEEKTVTVQKTQIELSDLKKSSKVSVKAVNEKGMEGWDWAHANVE